jgi:hypothetical protein
VLKKSFGTLAILFFLTGLTTFTLAQTYTGTLRGKIINEEGAALPDASIYLSSPNLLGIQTYFTSETGIFIFSGLPPGFYRLIAEMPEYKTISIDNIIIRAGKTAYLNITMETTPIGERISKTIPTPTIDMVSPKNATSIDINLLKHIPYVRHLVDVIDSVPGVVIERVPFLKRSFIHGQETEANTFAFDGIFMTDPMNRHLFTHFAFDTVEEIEVETAAHPAEVGATEGGYVNVITKSGMDRRGGELTIYHTSDKASSLLRPGDELNNPGISPPAVDKRLWDFSLSLGGSIYEDRLSYFGNARVYSQKRTTPFIPWTDPLGTEHKEFHRSNVEKMGFFKLTSRFIPELQASVLFNYYSRYCSVSEPTVSWNRPKESTHITDLEIDYTGTAVLSYIISQNTMAFGRVGFTHKKLPLGLDANGRDKPQYFDQGTEHHWGSAGFNEDILQDRFHLTASITHFQENFLGGDHEIKAGAEIEFLSSQYAAWKANNLLINYYYGMPNFFGQDISPSSSLLVNKGMVSFSIAAGYRIENNPKVESRRLSAFVQDSITLWERLTLALGLRFDRSDSELSTHSKGKSGNNVSLFIGENIIEPSFETNPFNLFSILSWKNIIVWNAFSPRIGLSFDIFGNGRFLFKASYSRYTEPLRLDYLTELNPLNPYRSHQFIWFDENMNDEVDSNDTYVPYPEDYRIYLDDYSRERVAPGIRAPYTDEFTVGFYQEIFRDFSLGVSYIHKTKKNILANVLYDPDQDREWYRAQDTQNWWIPFETIVPGVDDYPDSRLTVYYRSNDAPLIFSRLNNVPELKREHRTLEISFNKRMSHNWQLNGSLVFSQSTGNFSQWADGDYGFTNEILSPNSFVNFPEDSRFFYDTPLALKLAGTYKMPFGFFLSFYYRYMSGTPWTRSVAVIPPSAWTQANNAFSTPVTVLLEKPGERRSEPYSSFDLRIEKQFRVGRAGSFSFAADILNVLGTKNDFTFQNDGGFWYPDDENTAQGTRALSSAYRNITSLFGTRTLRLIFRLRF